MDEKSAKRTVVLEHLVHDAKRCIAIHCPYDAALIAAAKQAGANWSASHKRWYVPNDPQHLQAIFTAFKGVAWVDMNGLRKKADTKASTPNGAAPQKSQQKVYDSNSVQAPSAAISAKKVATALIPAQQEALSVMQRKLEIARYSTNTIDTYLNATKHFFLYFPQKHPTDIRSEDIEAYQHYMATTRKVSNSYLNQVVNAVRYYYKDVLGDAGFRQEVPLGSANSISIGRLLPQMAYYAHAALRHWRASGRPLNVVVPTGNLGNAVACLLARRCGLPIGKVVLANNANDGLARFFAGEDYQPHPTLATLANAMDVGAPNNFERLQWLYPGDAALRAAVSADSVDDAGIRATIVDAHTRFGEIICPHTACALAVLQRLRERGAEGDWCIVATAHPAKFPEVVEPLIGGEVSLPKVLAAMLAHPSHADAMANNANVLRQVLRDW